MVSSTRALRIRFRSETPERSGTATCEWYGRQHLRLVYVQHKVSRDTRAQRDSGLWEVNLRLASAAEELPERSGNNVRKYGLLLNLRRHALDLRYPSAVGIGEADPVTATAFS